MFSDIVYLSSQNISPLLLTVLELSPLQKSGHFTFARGPRSRHSYREYRPKYLCYAFDILHAYYLRFLLRASRGISFCDQKYRRNVSSNIARFIRWNGHCKSILHWQAPTKSQFPNLLRIRPRQPSSTDASTRVTRPRHAVARHANRSNFRDGSRIKKSIGSVTGSVRPG